MQNLEISILRQVRAGSRSQLQLEWGLNPQPTPVEVLGLRLFALTWRKILTSEFCISILGAWGIGSARFKKKYTFVLHNTFPRISLITIPINNSFFSIVREFVSFFIGKVDETGVYETVCFINFTCGARMKDVVYNYSPNVYLQYIVYFRGFLCDIYHKNLVVRGTQPTPGVVF